MATEFRNVYQLAIDQTLDFMADSTLRIVVKTRPALTRGSGLPSQAVGPAWTKTEPELYPAKVDFSGSNPSFSFGPGGQMTAASARCVVSAVPKQWLPATAYTVGQVRRPTVANSTFFLCTTAGTSDDTEPTWVTTAGADTTDNTVTWQALASWDTRGFADRLARFTVEAGQTTRPDIQIDGRAIDVQRVEPDMNSATVTVVFDVVAG